MSTADMYVYEPLPTLADSAVIRFLRVLPNLIDGNLQCELKHGEIEARQYTALSYTWGPQTDDRNILVNGKQLLIRRNLWDFLHIARHHYEEQYFWIDAVCIDQNNSLERNQQVSMMASIYQQAASTLIWLGPFGETMNTPEGTSARESFLDPTWKRNLTCLDKSFNNCQILDVDRNKDLRVENGYRMYGYKSPRRPWIKPNTWLPPKYGDFSLISNVVEVICDHSYWSRLWIIQEMGLSSNKFILLPGYTISWEPLLRVLKWILEGPEHPLSVSQVQLARSKLFRKAMERNDLTIHFDHGLSTFPPGYDPKWGSIDTKMSKFLLNKLIPAKASLIELDRLSTRFGSASPIFYQIVTEAAQSGREYLELLRKYKHSQSSDRRDKIYGLNSLATARQAASIHVDYSENVYDLYFRMSRLLLVDEQIRSERGVCLSLMETLNLGPLDLLFGDEKQRTEIYRCGTPDPDASPPPLKVLKEEIENGKVVALTGSCHRCDRPINLQLHLTWKLKLFYCVIQCHDLTDSLNANQNPQSSHVLVFDTSQLSVLQLSQRICSSDISSTRQNRLVLPNTRRYSFDALMTILRLHEKFYRIFDDRPWHRGGAQEQGHLEYMPPPWTHGRPSKGARGILHEYIQQWVGSSILAPKEKIGYTQDMLDAVWLEENSKSGFKQALADHGFKLINGQWSPRFDPVTNRQRPEITLMSTDAPSEPPED
ncbi:HET-domain-containing protein [Microthyrium microscopicum]|uniref:HET-domain-containing protein n=1 Tax=Microthyrium microscopicum TaxID=703497 RepID=A0A6A6UIQ4_9PEZI|nr:HET-domain-containing protein [Microthyrium microscopicum]